MRIAIAVINDGPKRRLVLEARVVDRVVTGYAARWRARGASGPRRGPSPPESIWKISFGPPGPSLADTGRVLRSVPNASS